MKYLKSNLGGSLVGILVSGLILLLVGGVYYTYQRYQNESSFTEEMGPSISKIINSEKIVIGTDATFPPMEFSDENGNLTGYDIELGTNIAEGLGIEVEFVDIAWDNIFDSLNRKDIDIIISSVTITEEREQLFDFSDAYINAGQVIITRDKNNSIRSTDDLQGKKIAVQRGTTNEAQALLYTSKELVIEFDDFIGATQALLAGDADAIFSDLTGAKGIVDANPELKIASDPFTSEFYGIVFRKGEQDLVEEVNKALESLRQSGVLELLKQKWLE